MRKAGLVVADTLKLIKQSAQVGMTTLDLNDLAIANLTKHGATSSFLGYHGFPAVICASVNEEVVHGIPNKRKLISGDVLSIDFGAIIQGWHDESGIIGRAQFGKIRPSICATATKPVDCKIAKPIVR